MWLASTSPLLSCSVSFDEPTPTFAALNDLLLHLSAPHLQNGMTLHFENLRLEGLSIFRKCWWGPTHAPPPKWVVPKWPYPEKGHGSRYDYVRLSTPLLTRFLSGYHTLRLQGEQPEWGSGFSQVSIPWGGDFCLFAKSRWDRAQAPQGKQLNSGRMICFTKEPAPWLLSPGSLLSQEASARYPCFRAAVPEHGPGGRRMVLPAP